MDIMIISDAADCEFADARRDLGRRPAFGTTGNSAFGTTGTGFAPAGFFAAGFGAETPSPMSTPTAGNRPSGLRPRGTGLASPLMSRIADHTANHNYTFGTVTIWDAKQSHVADYATCPGTRWRPPE